jgi:hypothetical protein
VEPEDRKRLMEGRLHDDWLDTALRKYGEAEPRPGLELRVLANLRAEQGRAVGRAWWPWAALAAVAIVIVIAVPLLRKPEKTTANSAADGPLTAKHSTQAAKNSEEKPAAPAVQVPVKRHATANAHPPARNAASPRLEQFPSPRPLSAQEEILANYVAQFREQAVLIARARTQELQKDLEEMSEAWGAGNTDSGHRINETQNR